MTSIVEIIQHYQRSIESSQDNGARLLHCINKLYKLPIKVEHLQETGVGKTVNSLRKFNGEIGVAAKALVTKWKAMVAAEEEPMDTTSQTNESETHDDANGDRDGAILRDDDRDENFNRNSTSQHHEQSRHNKNDKDKQREKHKDRNSDNSNGHKEGSRHSRSISSDHQNCDRTRHSNEKHKTSSISSKENSGSSSSKHKEKEREKDKSENKSSAEKHKERNHDKEKSRSDKKREEKHKSDKERRTESPNITQSQVVAKSNHASSSKSRHDDKHNDLPSKKEKVKERSEKYKSSSKDKDQPKDSTSSTSKHTTKDTENGERKRRHNCNNDSTDFKSPKPKAIKLHKSPSTASKAESSNYQKSAEQEEIEDSFDSSMGTNFDDVLGMLNVPVKKNKKSLKSPTIPTSSNSSSKNSTSSISQQPAASCSTTNKVNGTNIAFLSNYTSPNTSKACMKPDLLAPSAKLEPLDPSIALELPTISTNYKPMPLNQTVMDCVFNNSSTSSKPVRTLTDAEAISHGISSKTMRTKIYSGVRTGQTFQVPSLFDMCIRILQKNIDALEYTGGVPFEVLKPVLERATPQQLYVFEEYNPYLMEDSDLLWQQHVSRTYRSKKRIENESWREMFIRCQEEDERRLSVLKDSIKASQKMAAAPIRKTQLAFVDSLVKPPRNVLKKQEQFGTKTKLVATPAARVASLSSVTPNAAKTGDHRLKVSPAIKDHAQVSSASIRPKKAPLMQKTLQFIRGRHKR